MSETDLGRLLAAQKGLPFVELDPSALDPTASPLLPAEKARLHGALPIGFEAGVPVVAVADPSNDLVVENVRRALACEPVLVVAGRDALMRAIEHAYGNDATARPTPDPALVEQAAPALVEPQVAPVVEPVAAPVVQTSGRAGRKTAAPVPEPVAAPAVEPVVEQLVAPVAEAPAAPVMEPQHVPVVAPEPLAPIVTEPVPNGDGIWLGQPEPQEPEPPVAPVAPVAPPEPEPVVQAPVVEPQAVQVEAAPVVPTVQAPVEPVAPEPEVQPEPVPEPPPAAGIEMTWTVVLRLADGDRVEVGSFPGQEAAVEGARAVVAQIAADDSLAVRYRPLYPPRGHRLGRSGRARGHSLARLLRARRRPWRRPPAQRVGVDQDAAERALPVPPLRRRVEQGGREELGAKPCRSWDPRRKS